MPKWTPAPAVDGDDLERIFDKVNEEVGRNPRPQEYLGVDMDKLHAHSVSATNQFTDHVKQEGVEGARSLLHNETWAILYMMGFAVGVRYQKERDSGTDA